MDMSLDDIDLTIGTPTKELVEMLAGVRGRILVLGAGGKMGLHLCLQLHRALEEHGRANQLLAVSRFQTLRGREEFEKYGLSALPCDLTDSKELAALPDAEVIYFLAGTKFGTTSDPDLLNRLNVEMPRQVAERFKTSRIVALSTACVYPYVSPESGGAREDVPTVPNGAYVESCLGRERAFTDASVKHGTPCVLVRLSYSCEYRYGVLADVATRVYNGKPVPLVNGHACVIWQTDAVDMIARCLKMAESPPCLLNLSGPEITSIRWLAETFGQKFGRKVTFEGSESETAWLIDSSKAHQALGKPRVSLQEMIDLTAAWISKGGQRWDKPTKFEVRDGKF